MKKYLRYASAYLIVLFVNMLTWVVPFALALLLHAVLLFMDAIEYEVNLVAYILFWLGISFVFSVVSMYVIQDGEV